MRYSVPYKKTHKEVKQTEYNYDVILNKKRDENFYQVPKTSKKFEKK